MARARGREHVLCLGDSHVKVMRDVRLPGVWFKPVGVGGATASGILNATSASNAGKTFRLMLTRARPWHQILLMLGEVDCGYLIWSRAERLQIPVELQLGETLDAYETFIAEVVRAGFARVIVLSPPLPTITDDEKRLGRVARERMSVKATQRERSELTMRFVAALRERCERLGVVFVDVTSPELDPESELIDQRLVRENPRQHHLAQEPFSELVAAQLEPLWPRSQGGATI